MDLAVILGRITSVPWPLDICSDKPFRELASPEADNSLLAELFNRQSDSEADFAGL